MIACKSVSGMGTVFKFVLTFIVYSLFQKSPPVQSLIFAPKLVSVCEIFMYG